ncbi:hypothetical protein BC829DRAFT_396444, partial [Chytridium lagenaria]
MRRRLWCVLSIVHFRHLILCRRQRAHNYSRIRNAPTSESWATNPPGTITYPVPNPKAHRGATSSL